MTGHCEERARPRFLLWRERSDEAISVLSCARLLRCGISWAALWVGPLAMTGIVHAHAAERDREFATTAHGRPVMLNGAAGEPACQIEGGALLRAAERV
jgi:hypothetical protein